MTKKYKKNIEILNKKKELCKSESHKYNYCVDRGLLIRFYLSSNGSEILILHD